MKHLGKFDSNFTEVRELFQVVYGFFSEKKIPCIDFVIVSYFFFTHCKLFEIHIRSISRILRPPSSINGKK